MTRVACVQTIGMRGRSSKRQKMDATGGGGGGKSGGKGGGGGKGSVGRGGGGGKGGAGRGKRVAKKKVSRTHTRSLMPFYHTCQNVHMP